MLVRTVIGTIVEATEGLIPHGEILDETSKFLNAHFPTKIFLPFIDIAEIDDDNSAGQFSLEGIEKRSDFVLVHIVSFMLPRVKINANVRSFFRGTFSPL